MDSLRVPLADESGDEVKRRFSQFLQTYRLEEEIEFMNSETGEIMHDTRAKVDYMDQIISMIENNKSTVYVDFNHVIEADNDLAEAIELEYYRFEVYLRAAVQELVAINNYHYVHDVDKGQREFFIAFFNMLRVERIRSMRTAKIGKLMSISGTVTRSTEVRPELLYGSYICTKCGSVYSNIEQQFQYTQPHICKTNQCGSKSFQLILDKSSFVDWQRLRVQENADEIPPGSMPRCIEVICRNEVVERAKAGDKVIFTGMIAVAPDKSGQSRTGETTTTGRASGRMNSENNVDGGVQGLKELGVREMTYKMFFVAGSIISSDQRSSSGVNLTHTILPTDLLIDPNDSNNTDSSKELLISTLSEVDIADIKIMHHTPNLYDKMVESICPEVFGHHEVKRGILLMLCGGVHKRTAEGISLRGDLNVCIVGDPSCAKSQFLKYIHEFWPRSVFTSGKSSSAAGLTASVVRDNETGEFCVEAGALMLADNGICCIDEFDKMDPGDQVAIHEAMEQQTISITKAGIQATLNARTSILAAANPVFGRYDRTKTLKANIAISAPIMSRFDLFFVILDNCDPVTDEAIARHIIAGHKAPNSFSQTTSGLIAGRTKAPFMADQLRRYIQFCRTLNPTMTSDSRKVLVECYRLLRQNDILGKNKTAYRITVRQLESLVRLSEALARLHLSEVIEPQYVREAYRLLQMSIIFVESEDVELDNGMEEDVEEISGSSSHDSNLSESISSRTNTVTQSISNNIADENTAPNTRKRLLGSDIPSYEPSSEEKATESHIIPVPEKKKKSHVSASDYNRITKILALRLKLLEEQSIVNMNINTNTNTMIESEGNETMGSNVLPITSYKGCQWKDLLQWYLTENQEQLTSTEDFDSMKELINKIIRRMIKHDGSIMIVGQDDMNIPNEEKYLKLHPSFVE